IASSSDPGRVVRWMVNGATLLEVIQFILPLRVAEVSVADESQPVLLHKFDLLRIDKVAAGNVDAELPSAGLDVPVEKCDIGAIAVAEVDRGKVAAGRIEDPILLKAERQRSKRSQPYLRAVGEG